MDGLSPQWGGVSGRVHFSRFFFTFNVKIMSKNWKRTIKLVKKKHSPFLGGAGGGVSGKLD